MLQQCRTMYYVSSSHGGHPVVNQSNSELMVFEPMNGNGAFGGLCWVKASFNKKGVLCIEHISDLEADECDRIEEARSTHHFWFEKITLPEKVEEDNETEEGDDCPIKTLSGAFMFGLLYGPEVLQNLSPSFVPTRTRTYTPDGGGSLV